MLGMQLAASGSSGAGHSSSANARPSASCASHRTTCVSAADEISLFYSSIGAADRFTHVSELMSKRTASLLTSTEQRRASRPVTCTLTQPLKRHRQTRLSVAGTVRRSSRPVHPPPAPPPLPPACSWALPPQRLAPATPSAAERALEVTRWRRWACQVHRLG